MTGKNLSDAFGDIDDSLFAITETESVNQLSQKNSDDVQAPVFIKNISENKARKHRKALISAVAGIAACTALAVSLPVLFNNTAPPYEEAESSRFPSQQPAQTETDQQTEQIGAVTQPVITDVEQVITDFQLYTEIKEILDVEDIYKVEKIQIVPNNIEGSEFGDNEALWSIYANRAMNGTVLIDDNSFFYTVLGYPRPDGMSDEEYSDYGSAKLFLYDMNSGKHTLILTEQSYKGKHGLMYKPMNYVNCWLYYYRMEYMPQGDFSNEETELWRINIDTGVKEKITDIYQLYYFYMEAGVRSGKYLYFTDTVYSVEGSEVINSYILQYDTEKGKLDVFREEIVKEGKGNFPFVYGYKNGIIYSIDGISFYFHTDDGEPDKLLPELSSYNQDSKNYFQTVGNSKLIYARDIPTAFDHNLDSIGTVIGVLDENFKARELAYFPWYATLVDVDADLDLKPIMTGLEHFNDTIFIYDTEADCFSKLKLPSEAYNAVYFTGQDDELRVLVLWSDGLVLYSIKK